MKKNLMLILSTVLFVNAYADDFVNQKLNEQDELIDDIELQVANMNQTISSLKLDNLDLTEHIDELEKSNIKMNNKITNGTIWKQLLIFFLSVKFATNK